MLVFRTGHLGDTVCAIPALRLIRSNFPHAELTLLCDQPDHHVKVSAVEVVRNLGLFDHILTYSSRRGLMTAWQLFRAIRRVRPGTIFLLPQVRETIQSIRFKKEFFGWCGVSDVRGPHIVSFNHNCQLNEANRLVAMLNELGVRGTKPAYDVPPDETSRASLEKKLEAANLNFESRFAVFCGGGKAATQHWPLERYADVLARIAAETGWDVLGVGTAQEVEGYRAGVLPKLPELKLTQTPLTIPETFELLRKAHLYIGNDTGPMHVAAAVGCPVAVVMSARNPAGIWDPDVEPRLVIRHRTTCEGCFLSTCVLERHRCMTSITVERVLRDLLPFIASLPTQRVLSRCAESAGF